MSDDYNPDGRNYQLFNRTQARRIGWGIALDLVARDKVFGATADLRRLAEIHARDGAGSEAFGVAVEAYQRQNELVADRKLGIATWQRLALFELRKPAALDMPFRTVKVGGLQVTAPDIGVAFVKKPLSSFNRMTAERRRKVILHWGGWNVPSCFATLENDGHSTHFMVEPMLGTLQDRPVLVVHQGVDLAFTAHHAAGVNDHAIGIDICRTPLVQYASRYPDAQVIDNTSSRGERRVLDLPDEIARRVRALAEWVADLWGIPTSSPYPGDGVLADIQGATDILGHHHVSPRKWDVAPWAPKLWPAR